ncbi:MAG: hypothetical protein IIC12_07415 [Proteobacteria bacterium]|nr:hypothetical protein [Pseudomonadota bacterium]
MAAAREITAQGEIRYDEPMSRHTSWRAGGPAEVFFVPASIEDLAEFLAALPEPRFLLGQGIPFHAEALRSVPHECLPKSLWLPRVETVCRLGFERAQQGQFQDPSTLTPLYPSRPEAEEVWEKKHGQGTGGTA